jgi:hypothetical protein
LKNAAGSHLQSHSAKDFVAEHQNRKLPQLRGDLVAEELKGKSGYLYYGAATYSWYDPETFNGEPERSVVHMAPASARR